VFEIIDDSKLYVEASVDEADVSRVRTGQPATLTLDALTASPALCWTVSAMWPAVNGVRMSRSKSTAPESC